MRVSIITFHRAVNYGAVLQAYALQEKIRQLGNEVEIIDYRCPLIEEEVSPLAGFRKKNGLVSSMKKFVFRIIKNRAFNKFMKKRLNLSTPYYVNDDLSETNEKYDCYITGSDQVWNYGCSGADTSFFLDFVDDSHNKVSYAASFGYDKLPAADPFDYKELLKGFNAISVRERSAVDIVEERVGIKPVVTLDPTLLLLKSDWQKLVLKRPYKGKYIFVYYIRESKDLLNYAYKLAEEKNCKVINSKRSIEFLQKCSPQDFLTWFYHADYVVTNSFHGTVFSLLFEKKFVVELDNGKSVNNRSKELLSSLEVVGREIDMSNIDMIETPIDYSNAMQKLDTARKNSIAFLQACFRE